MRPLLITLATVIPLISLASPIVATDSARLFFRQSQIHPDLDYMGNDTLHIFQIPSNRISKIRITGSASPEGPINFNQYLSQARAQAISALLLPDMASQSITDHRYLGPDWQGLYQLAKTDPELPYNDHVLPVLEDFSNRQSRGITPTPDWLQTLKSLNQGTPYSYLYKNIFPRLRYSTIIIDYLPTWPETLLTPPQTTAVVTDTLLLQPYRQTRKHHKFLIAIKSNLLYDAAAIPNIGLEFPFCHQWSAGIDWNYAWWSHDSSHRYWRCYGGDIFLRFWLGDRSRLQPLTGHHLGLFGGLITYDFEFGAKGYMGGLPGKTLWDRCNAFGGFEYGYSLPIARHFNLDFTIGIGYLGGKVIEYEPCQGAPGTPLNKPGYRYLKTKRLTWIGPVKAEITLVYNLSL